MRQMNIVELIDYLNKCYNDFGEIPVVGNAEDFDGVGDFIALDQIPRRHTATTEHACVITVQKDGDEGVTPDELQDYVRNALDEIDGIRAIGVRVGLNMLGKEVAMVLADHDTHTELAGSAIREYDADGRPTRSVFTF